MATIKANLSDSGEVGYLLYGNVEHYVAILKDNGDSVYFVESHFFGDTISYRTLPKKDFQGFYDLP